MQNFSDAESADAAALPFPGAVSDGNATKAELEPITLTGADPVDAGGAKDRSMDPGPEAPTEASTTPTPAAESTNSDNLDGQSSAARQMRKYLCIEEPIRNGKNKLTSWKPLFEAEEGSEEIFKAILERAEGVRAPLQATPVPTGTARYESTIELFGRLQNAIAEQALVTEETSALLTYFAVSTWFVDVLPIAPGLSIVGPEFQGDLVLRALRNFCRYPMMLTGADIPSLQKLYWQTTPTVLLFAPNISKQMVTTLGSTAARGYLVNCGGGFKDLYGPKALYLGEDVSMDRILRSSPTVRLQPASSARATQHSFGETEAAVQELQNQLLGYRTKNLIRVYNSDFDAASLLASDMRAIGNALGACIVDSPELQAQLISLLTPIEAQRQADRSTGLEATALEAVLNLAHAGKEQVMVAEIATEVNRLAMARGERQRTSAERVGHALKKIGLATRRLGRAGRGLLMDPATMTRAHALAREHGGAGLEPDEINLHCPLCIEKKIDAGGAGYA